MSHVAGSHVPLKRLPITAFVLGLISIPSVAFGWAILGGAGVLIGFVAAPLGIAYGLVARRQGGRGRRIAATGLALGALAIVWLAAYLTAFAIREK